MAGQDPQAIADDLLSKLKADQEGQDDWRACDSQVYVCVQDCLQQLLEGRSPASRAKELSRLLILAQDAIEGVHHTKVQRKWRRLYTDVCIMRGLKIMIEPHGADRLDAIRGAIKDLDMAIIVCGAPGRDRLGMIYREIACLQEEVPMPPHLVSEIVHEAPHGHSIQRDSQAICLASSMVKEAASVPSLSDYLSRDHAEPFVVRCFASDWPAIDDENHNWADGNYLSRMGGPYRVVPVEIGRQYTDADWYQGVIPWVDFLEATGWTTAKEAETSSIYKEDKPKYLAQHNIFRQFPALEADIIVPDIIYSCPPAPHSFSQYKPPIDEEGLETTLVNAWIGPQGTTTPAHFDPYYNAYVQVVGQKLLWIAPPDFFPSEDMSLIDDNTSTLSVFEENTKDTELSRRAFQMAMKVVLGPGDLLVLPPGWWHAVRSLSRSFSVSMWY